jgi:hypothetical protein
MLLQNNYRNQQDLIQALINQRSIAGHGRTVQGTTTANTILSSNQWVSTARQVALTTGCSDQLRIRQSISRNTTDVKRGAQFANQGAAVRASHALQPSC